MDEHMSEITVTKQDIIDLINAATFYLDNISEGKLTRFGYAVTRTRQRAQKLYKRIEQVREDLQVKHCAVDEKNVILKDERNQYRFTKEGLDEFNKDYRALREEEVQIEPHFLQAPEREWPENLPTALFDVFEKFLLREPLPEPPEQKDAEKSQAKTTGQ
jgi:hypothetical protein